MVGVVEKKNIEDVVPFEGEGECNNSFLIPN
jgi:hypothetical protein